MIVRGLDSDGDWTFGKSLNNYISKNAAIIQNIRTRLLSFLGDCIFDITAGIDWFTLLGGSKSQIVMQINISSVILNTQFVTGILQLTINLLENNRTFSIAYQAQTVFSVIGDQFQYTVGI